MQADSIGYVMANFDIVFASSPPFFHLALFRFLSVCVSLSLPSFVCTGLPHLYVRYELLQILFEMRQVINVF